MPEGSSSEAPVTTPGPGMRDTSRSAFLVRLTLRSVTRGTSRLYLTLRVQCPSGRARACVWSPFSICSFSSSAHLRLTRTDDSGFRKLEEKSDESTNDELDEDNDSRIRIGWLRGDVGFPSSGRPRGDEFSEGFSDREAGQYESCCHCP